MNKGLLFLLFMITFLVSVLRIEVVFALTEGAYCLDCDTTESSTLSHFENEIDRNLHALNEPYNQVRHVQKLMKWHDTCENFATDNGQGQWSNAVYSSFVISPLDHLLEGTQDLFQLCPRFNQLKIRERVTVYTVLINAMVYYESSCNEKIKPHRGPNGSLSGILQLHLGKENEYHPACNQNDSKNPKRSIKCALEMLNSQVKRTNKLFSEHSYWAVLRPYIKIDKKLKLNPHYQNIRRAIRSIRICH